MCYSTMDCCNSESSRNGVLHYGTVVGETESLLRNREISLAALKACHLKRNGNSLYLAFGC